MFFNKIIIMPQIGMPILTRHQTRDWRFILRYLLHETKKVQMQVYINFWLTLNYIIIHTVQFQTCFLTKKNRSFELLVIIKYLRIIFWLFRMHLLLLLLIIITCVERFFFFQASFFCVFSSAFPRYNFVLYQ